MMPWITTFVAMFVLDVVWAWWGRALGAKRALSAATSTVFITFFSGVVQISYVADNKLLIPACAGAFVGTWVSVRFGR